MRFVGVDVAQALAEGEVRGGQVVLLDEGLLVGGGHVVEGFEMEGRVVHVRELVRGVVERALAFGGAGVVGGGTGDGVGWAVGGVGEGVGFFSGATLFGAHYV